MKVMLISSPGGHLAQLLPLREALEGHEVIWVTAESPHTAELAERDRVEYTAYPTTRHVPNALRNLAKASRLLREDRPDVIVSAGAGVAAPFFLIAWQLKIPSVYIEVIDRISTRTLTGAMVYPFATRFIVQWREQARLYPGALVSGALL
ncbi:PssD/Cps14F family polysaccharide biosynthesis glycosyltransferase [Ornithinimicrobium sp. Y1847]|uniref:PssD/Cps14F family polysaccharide biosynthesis glycosyltransferase n=1 Tax=Ornithinimicrobium sp. Y1847 TaxID=3405419 RepID=UPI003B67481C